MTNDNLRACMENKYEYMHVRLFPRAHAENYLAAGMGTREPTQISLRCSFWRYFAKAWAKLWHVASLWL